jgi:hypothetical protein
MPDFEPALDTLAPDADGVKQQRKIDDDDRGGHGETPLLVQDFQRLYASTQDKPFGRKQAQSPMGSGEKAITMPGPCQIIEKSNIYAINQNILFSIKTIDLNQNIC